MENCDPNTVNYNEYLPNKSPIVLDLRPRTSPHNITTPTNEDVLNQPFLPTPTRSSSSDESSFELSRFIPNRLRDNYELSFDSSRCNDDITSLNSETKKEAVCMNITEPSTTSVFGYCQTSKTTNQVSSPISEIIPFNISHSEPTDEYTPPIIGRDSYDDRKIEDSYDDRKIEDSYDDRNIENSYDYTKNVANDPNPENSRNLTMNKLNRKETKIQSPIPCNPSLVDYSIEEVVMAVTPTNNTIPKKKNKNETNNSIIPGSLNSCLSEIKTARKQSENEALVLKNRIKLLMAEEQRANRRIEQARAKCDKIIKCREEHMEQLIERENQKRIELMKLEEKRRILNKHRHHTHNKIQGKQMLINENKKKQSQSIRMGKKEDLNRVKTENLENLEKKRIEISKGKKSHDSKLKQNQIVKSLEKQHARSSIIETNIMNEDNALYNAQLEITKLQEMEARLINRLQYIGDVDQNEQYRLRSVLGVSHDHSLPLSVRPSSSVKKKG